MRIDLWWQFEVMEVARKLHFDACDIEDEELNISSLGNNSSCDIEDVFDSSTEYSGCLSTLQPKKLSFTSPPACDLNETFTVPYNNNKTPAISVTG